MARQPTLPHFLNALRIMRSIDAHEFVKVGLTSAQWTAFNQNPMQYILRCDSDVAQTIWGIIEGRQPK